MPNRYRSERADERAASADQNDEPAFNERELPPTFGATVMPMFVASADGTEHLGNAFAVTADGLLLTAGHVVTDVHARMSRGVQCMLFAIVEADGSSAGVAWAMPAHVFSWHPTADVAAIWLDLPADGPVPSLNPIALDASPLAEGSECMTFGFSKASIRGPVLPRATPPDYDRQFVASRGTVLEVHPRYFDRGAWKYPLMVTNSRNLGGMSGSPVVGDGGTARGLVAAGSPEERCYVALLADALTLWIPSDDVAQPEMVLTHIERRSGAVAGVASFDVFDTDVAELNPLRDEPTRHIKYFDS